MYVLALLYQIFSCPCPILEELVTFQLQSLIFLRFADAHCIPSFQFPRRPSGWPTPTCPWRRGRARRRSSARPRPTPSPSTFGSTKTKSFQTRACSPSRAAFSAARPASTPAWPRTNTAEPRPWQCLMFSVSTFPNESCRAILACFRGVVMLCCWWWKYRILGRE